MLRARLTCPHSGSLTIGMSKGWDFAPGFKSNELPNIPTNYPIIQRTALKTNEPLNIPTNLPINPTNPRNNPTNPVLASSAEKPHKHKKGRSREHPRSALNREKAQKYWCFWQKEKYSDSIEIRVLLWQRTLILIQ